MGLEVNFLRWPTFTSSVEREIESCFPLERVVTKVLNYSNQQFQLRDIGVFLVAQEVRESCFVNPCYLSAILEGIYIFFNISSPNYASACLKRLPASMAHEFAHVVRLRSRPWVGILGERAIMEGTGIYFEKMMFPGLKIRDLNTSSEKIEAMCAEAKKSLDDDVGKISLQRRWIDGKEDLPENAIYDVGYRWVKQYVQKNNPSLNDLIKVDREEFFNVIF